MHKMALTFARKQSSVFSTEADPAVATFASTPVEDNLLVVIATERSGGDAANYTISGSGWTKQISETTEPSGNRRTFAVWWKVAGASEPTQISVDDGTANSKRIMIQEYEAGEAVDWTYRGVAKADTGSGSTSPLASGDTASIPAGEQLLVGCAIWRREGTGALAGIAFSGLSSVVSDIGGDQGRSIASAFARESASGVKATSLSWTGTGHEGNVGLLVFTAVAQNQPPTIALGTNVVNEATITNTKPAFEFTGTDPDSDDVRYQIQIDTANTFDSQ